MIQNDLQQAFENQFFTAVEVLQAQSGKIVFHKKIFQVKEEKYFDLASLTKPLSAAFLMMLAVQEKELSLEDKVNEILPTKNLKNVPVWRLLNHTSPLVYWYAFGQDYSFQKQGFQKRRQEIFQRVFHEKQFQRRSFRTLYSDLGYMALTSLLETVYQKRIDQLFKEKIAEPLKIEKGIFYHPLSQKLLFAESDFVPSEKFCLYRKKKIQAEVMDKNAWLMDGVSGHAGLFGTAKSIHFILKEWSLALRGKSKILEQDIAEKFLLPTLKRKVSRRYFTLGLDTPTKPGSLSGIHFTKKTIGHLGYSGTSFWWDMEKDVWMIVLTNGRYYGREDPPFLKWLPGLYNQLMKDI